MAVFGSVEKSTSGCFSEVGVVKGLRVLAELDEPGGGGVCVRGREKFCTSADMLGVHDQSIGMPGRRLLGTRWPVSAT